jgi:high-affinity iron transporter
MTSLFSAGVFAQSASILLREGLEALLVISALAAYLRKSNAADRLWALYTGAGAGILASFLLAVAIALFFDDSLKAEFEFAVYFGAAALMFYVSGWLFVRQDPRAWQSFLRSNADKALSANNVVGALAVLAFMSVLREGGETVLFYFALANAEGGWSVSLFAGIGAAALGLVVLYGVMQVITMRIPLRPLFLITSTFLFMMALKFVGSGLHELRELNFVGETNAPSATFLDLIGFNPTWEAIAAQLVIILAGIVTFAVMHFRSSAATTVTAGR